MSRVVVVEFDRKIGEVAPMRFLHPRKQGFGRYFFGFGAQHHGRAVRVFGANEAAFVAAHFLESRPNVGLYVFDQMPDMDLAVGVRQGRGH